MERTPLFGENIVPCCDYCAHSRLVPDKRALLCQLTQQPVPTPRRCENFVYDPLRRVPKRRPDLPRYSPEDFKL